jgi:predicted dehydrogenase
MNGETSQEVMVKVGIIGAGLQGRRHAQAVKKFGDEVLIVAAAHLERAKILADELQCQATANWEEVTARGDVEVVFVCTPPNLHHAMCTAAIREGKHVFCEKPLALNPEEAKEIVNLAQQNGVKVKCGFNLRHHPGIQQARKWFDDGLIGEPLLLRNCYGIGGRPGYEKEWRMKPEISGGGQLMDQGMHALDLARWFLGDFTKVFGVLQTAFWDIAPVEDNAFVLLHTEKGQVASLHVSWTQWKNLFSFEIFGRDGYITVQGLGGSYGVEKAILGKRAFLEPFKEETIEYRGEDRSWYEQWSEFAGAIKENRQPQGNGDDGFKAVELAHAVYESARRDCMVRLRNQRTEKGSYASGNSDWWLGNQAETFNTESA